jgi:hypothetical protein
MAGGQRHLYRGTSLNWPGNPALQSLNKTPATTDPLVATLFAIESCRHGSGIVYFANRETIVELLDVGNVLAQHELEFVVNVTPQEFADRYAAHVLDAATAREILKQMGFAIPAVIPDREFLNKQLKALARLSALQVEEFDRRALG